MVKAVSACMFIRAILSWFDVNTENPLIKFLFAMTEPVVYPVRLLFEKMNWFQSVPIDMSFSATFLILFVLETLIELTLR